MTCFRCNRWRSHQKNPKTGVLFRQRGAIRPRWMITVMEEVHQESTVLVNSFLLPPNRTLERNVSFHCRDKGDATFDVESSLFWKLQEKSSHSKEEVCKANRFLWVMWDFHPDDQGLFWSCTLLRKKLPTHSMSPGNFIQDNVGFILTVSQSYFGFFFTSNPNKMTKPITDP